MTQEEKGKTYALHKASEKLHDYYGSAMLNVVQFDGHDIQCAYVDGYLQAKQDLEVKEVDLEGELNNWRHNHFHGRRDKEASGEYLKRNSQLDLAKYFFELGLKVQKGE